MSKRNSRGFTLIELMIVVVMIGILAAIAIPNFIAMRHRAQEAATMANMRTFQRSADDYGVMYDGMFATDDSLVVEVLPASSYDLVAKRMRNSVTRKFTEPSDVPAPGAFIYSFKDNKYTIIGFDHKGIALPDTLIGGK